MTTFKSHSASLLHRTSIRLASIGALCLLALSQAACPSATESTKPTEPSDSVRQRLAGAAEGRNVLLISVDTLRADRLGAYGYDTYPTSPAIDDLLSRGVVFERTMAPRAATWPSLASALTGLYPSGHGVIENGYSFPDDLETLPLALRKAGYRSGAFLSNMCKANHTGWDAFACSGGRDRRSIDAALEWANADLDPTEAQKPQLLWVHLFGAHGPYYNGGARAAEWNPDYAGELVPKKWALDRVMKEKLELTPADRERLEALYGAAIRGTDGLVNELLHGLGLLDRGDGGDRGDGEGQTKAEDWLIVFFADHGEELYQHNGYLYHACSVYQSTLHVPLAIIAPGLLDEQPIDGVVELVDLAPTLVELLGLNALPEAQGASLVPLLERGGGATKPAFSEYSGEPIHTVLDDRWKLVSNPQEIEPFCIVGAEPGHYPIRRAELYDLATDPTEQNDLSASMPDRVRALEALLARHLVEVGAGRGKRQDVDPELRKELEALGYIAK